MTLIRYRSALWVHVATALVIAGLGLGEVLAGDLIGNSGFANSLGSSFRLVVFAIGIVVGFERQRRLQPPLIVASLASPPAGSEIANLPRTVGRVAVTWIVPLLADLVGLFVPVIGAVAGGITLGAASRLARSGLKLLRIERRDNVRVLYALPPQWLSFGRETTGGYFRVAAAPSGRLAPRL